MDKSYSNNLLGRDLIEKLIFFPGVKNLNLKKFDDIVKNYKINNSNPIKNLAGELYSKLDHTPFFSEG